MKTVLFDAGNTLVSLDHAFIVELLREHGVAATRGRNCDCWIRACPCAALRAGLRAA